jgi:quercetin dioxygenase-like cupin family protein
MLQHNTLRLPLGATAGLSSSAGLSGIFQRRMAVHLRCRLVGLTFSCIAGIVVLASVAAQPAGVFEDAPAAVCVLPEEMAWKSDPNVHGLQTAVLFGDPGKSAPYVQRIAFPANHRIAPHSHPDEARMVTVLSGTLYFAFGTEFDESKLKPLPAGTFFIEPKNTPHYAMTKGAVVLQLHAIGPSGTVYVKAARRTPHD